MKTTSTHPFIEELKQTLLFALPIVLAQVGFNIMGIVDTMMVGKINAEAIAATGLARSYFWVVAIFGMGTLSAIDVLSSHEVGANNDPKSLRKILAQSFSLTWWLSLALLFIILLARQTLFWLNSDTNVINQAYTYLTIVGLGMPLLMFFTTLQRYWQSQGVTQLILWMMIGANVLNYFFNIIFIWGDYGIPALGLEGAALATNLSRILLLLGIIALTVYQLKTQNSESVLGIFSPFNLTKNFVTQFLKIGTPVGAQLTSEFGLFSSVTILAAFLTPFELAAHHIVLMIVSTTYMFPVGFASAAAFRVGQFYGAKNLPQARLAGWSSLTLSMLVMGVFSIILFFYAEPIIRFFSTDSQVIEFGLQIAFWGALFQVVDAIQGVGTGALRGLGNTKLSSITSFLSSYPIGVALGALLCFQYGFRLNGLWIGLCVGLTTMSVFILYFWIQLSKDKNKSRSLKTCLT